MLIRSWYPFALEFYREIPWLPMTGIFQSTVVKSEDRTTVCTKRRDDRDASYCGFIESECGGRNSCPPLLMTCQRNCRRIELISVEEHDDKKKYFSTAQ